MNISRISSGVTFSAPNTVKTTAPAFGLAKLNERGVQTADSFGWTRNEFMNARLFERQGFFSKPAILSELSNPERFPQVCIEYGCTNNAKSNADFITTQILPKKAQKAIKGKVEPTFISEGLTRLYECNFDNPELSLADTKALLDLIKDDMPDTEYVKNIGFFEVGADK